MDKYTEELLLSCCFSFTYFMFSLCIVFAQLWTFNKKWLFIYSAAKTGGDTSTIAYPASVQLLGDSTQMSIT